jgi:hypothetical protein
MPLPIHKNPSSARTACAPYNFVPLPEVMLTYNGACRIISVGCKNSYIA